MPTASTRSKPDASLAVHRTRLARLRTLMRARKLALLLVTDPAEIRYLTGFHGEASWIVVGATDKPTIISDLRLAEDIEPVRPLAKVHIRSGETMVDAVMHVLARTRARLGVPRAHLTLETYAQLAKALGAKRLVATGSLIGELRLRKDASEIATIRKAIRIQQAALEEVLPTIEPGQSESEICALLEYEMKARGADGPAFETIIAAGANSSKPHARPGRAKVRSGQLLLIDWGACVDGYHSDLTRTFAIGRWPRRFEEIYTIVLDAQLAAIDAVKPGVRTDAVDAAARSIITDAGYGEVFGHGLGHGIGLNIHEAPSLGRVSPSCLPSVLEEGMVVTVEPGIYLPGAGGVRIEDDVLVTARGRRVLSSLPKDKRWAKLA